MQVPQVVGGALEQAAQRLAAPPRDALCGARSWLERGGRRGAHRLALMWTDSAPRVEKVW